MATGPTNPTGYAGSERQPVVQNVQSPRVAEVQQQESVEPIQRSLWDRQPPPQLNLHAQLPSVPQQLAIAHVQRKRDMASLGERLAILLPHSGSLPEGLTIGAPDVAVLPGSLRSVAQRRPQVDRISITAPETPEKVQKLSQKLTALLGPSGRDHPSAPSKRVAKPTLSSHELLLQNSSKVVGQADRLVDFVLEQILRDSVHHLETMPSKVEAHRGHREDQRAAPAADVPAAEDTTLQRMVQSATDRLLIFEHELRMTYGEKTAPSAKPSWTTPVRRKEVVKQSEEDEAWRVASLPAKRVLELERYRARFAHHCMAAREAGIQSGPGSKTATWVIWPYLADSIAMAVVESAMEEVDNAMEDYVDLLIQEEVGCPGERTLQQ